MTISTETISNIHSWLSSVPQSLQNDIEKHRHIAIEESHDFDGDAEEIANYLQETLAKSNKDFYKNHSVIEDVHQEYSEDVLFIYASAGNVVVSVGLTMNEILALAIDANLHEVTNNDYDDEFDE